MNELKESEITDMIGKFEADRKRLFDSLGRRGLEEREEKVMTTEMKVVESIVSLLIRLRKLKR